MDFTYTPPNNTTQDPLKDFGKNITDLATENNLDPIIGRDDEIRRVIQILSRKTKNNPVLVGDPGVGKTAIVEGLAQKIVAKLVPENLKNKKIVELDLGSMMAGASFQGQFEKRIKDVLAKVEKSNGEIILFVDEVHTLVGAGRNGQGGLDAAQILKPLLARGKIRLIGATTLDEYRKYIEQDGALERRMQKVMVNEPTAKESISILRGLKERLETFHGVKIHDNALVSAVELSTRYISDRKLPDKAIDLVDEAAAAIQIEMNSKPEQLEKAEQKVAIFLMEQSALKKEKDDRSKARINELNEQIRIAKENVEYLKDRWETEKKKINQVTELKDQIDQLKAKMSRYQANGEYEKASIILYKEIPNAEKSLKKAEASAKDRESFLVKEDVTSNEIANIVAKWTQIPITKLLKSEKDKLLALGKYLALRVKGQSEAIKIVTAAILRAKADINDPNRPLGSFIFMGPTGVGKTEVARALANELFDSEKHMVRIDMSEYMEEHSVSRLIGSPPGYVGYDQGGQLTEAIRNKPYSIVLLDEIEKAHPKVLDVLLQVLDDGQLTDGRGKTINFKNTIVIMTTNIGAIDIIAGKPVEEIKMELHKYLRPEFLNRVDEVIAFNSLTREVINEIAQRELNILSARVKAKGYHIDFTKEVVNKVAKEAYDPQFGARPIKRYIKKNIESQLAIEIISQNIKFDLSYEVIVEKNKFIYRQKRLN